MHKGDNQCGDNPCDDYTAKDEACEYTNRDKPTNRRARTR